MFFRDFLVVSKVFISQGFNHEMLIEQGNIEMSNYIPYIYNMYIYIYIYIYHTYIYIYTHTFYDLQKTMPAPNSDNAV